MEAQNEKISYSFLSKISAALKDGQDVLSKGEGKISKLYKGVKDFATGNYDAKISGIFNVFIYFLALTGIMNIIYFSFFSEMNIIAYPLLCIILPLVVSVGVKSSGLISHLYQKIFFNEREIAIIAFMGIVTFLISFSMS